METVELEVWVLVNEDGDAVADCDPDHLPDEWAADIGAVDPSKATRLICVRLRIPKPAPLVMAGEVPAEVAGGELKAA